MHRLTTLVAKKYEVSVPMDGVVGDASRYAFISLYDIPLIWRQDGRKYAPIAIVYNTQIFSNDVVIGAKQNFITAIGLALTQLRQATPNPAAKPVQLSSNYHQSNPRWETLKNAELIKTITAAKTALQGEIDEIIRSFMDLSIDERINARKIGLSPPAKPKTK